MQSLANLDLDKGLLRLHTLFNYHARPCTMLIQDINTYNFGLHALDLLATAGPHSGPASFLHV